MAENTQAGTLEMIHLDALHESPNQVRQVEGTPELDAGIDELAGSIRANGLIEPLVVRRVTRPDGPGMVWELIAGHRRLAACRKAGLTSAPCYALGDGGMTEEAAAEMTLVENLQRRDLTAMEEATAVGRLLELHADAPDRHERVAKACGKSVRWVYRRASITGLSKLWHDQALKYGLSAAYLERVARLPIDIQDDVFGSLLCTSEDVFTRGGNMEVLEEEIEVDLRRLSAAPWAHIPGDPAKCGGCPKRTDAQADLFEDWAGEPRCLDRACWEGKVEAYIAQARKQAKESYGKIIEAGSESAYMYREKGDSDYSVPVLITNGSKRGAIMWAPNKDAAAEQTGSAPAAPKGPRAKDKARWAYVKAVAAAIENADLPDWGDGHPSVPDRSVSAFACACGVNPFAVVSGAFASPLERALAIIKKDCDPITLLWASARRNIVKAFAIDEDRACPDTVYHLAEEVAAALEIPGAIIAQYEAEFAPKKAKGRAEKT